MSELIPGDLPMRRFVVTTTEYDTTPNANEVGRVEHIIEAHAVQVTQAGALVFNSFKGETASMWTVAAFGAGAWLNYTVDLPSDDAIGMYAQLAQQEARAQQAAAGAQILQAVPMPRGAMRQ